MKKLKKILKEVPLTLYRGSKEVVISGLSENSKVVAPGNLFIVKKGLKEDGSKYIEEAISNGAVAILLTESDPFLKNVVQLTYPDISKIEGKLAATYYDNPAKKLFTVGVTGTNGKTTVTYLIKHLLESFRIRAGLIGTVEYVIGDKRIAGERTTPDVISNHKMLREMISAKCKAALLEVTSHGLTQGRVDNIDFDVAVFTNLTHDHLDYHHTLEAYAEAKKRLFTSLAPSKTAVICKESPFALKMIESCKAKLFTYGFTPDCDLYAHDMVLGQSATSFKVSYRDKTFSVSWGQIGRHNVLNALAAISVLLVKGYALSKILPHLLKFKAAPGRLERVGSSSVFVDYAHTPDALENVLLALKEFKKGRIITLFGCGGERDQKKRPIMASVAEKYSDFTIVTSDNPRSEDPQKIVEEIVRGFKSSHFTVELDRRVAIFKAISLAQREDLILIAGKGHETYQIFARQRVPFDDREVAAQALSSAAEAKACRGDLLKELDE